VFSREVYAQREFWDSRFEETSGFFDWYANWKQISPVFREVFPIEEYGNATHLMVGCGNSRMSDEMAADGYPWVTNMDISPVVLGKMKSKDKSNFDFIALDATKMNFRDNTFDLCIDKGIFDALACGPDRTVLRDLLQEMNRVASTATVIITSGTPDRRMHYFTEFLEGQYSEIVNHKIEISNVAHLINILRAELKNKPLSHAIKKDPEVFKKAIAEMARIKREKELAEAAKTDPKSKLLLLLLKGKRMKEKEAEEAKAAEAAKQAEAEGKENEAPKEVNMAVDEKGNKINYNPKRQDFVMVYVIYKKKI